MGTWGTGNFENDTSLDFLALLLERWMSMIDGAIAGAAPEEAASLELAPGLELVEGCVLPTVELLIATIEHFEAESYPPPEKVEEWSRASLAAYDSEIDGFGPDEAYEVERRQVISGTFDRLLAIAREHRKVFEQGTKEG